jgi:hypothetical protein
MDFARYINIVTHSSAAISQNVMMPSLKAPKARHSLAPSVPEARCFSKKSRAEG